MQSYNNFDFLLKEECESIKTSLMNKESVYKMELPISKIDGIIVTAPTATFIVWNDVCSVLLFIPVRRPNNNGCHLTYELMISDDKLHEFPWTTEVVESLMTNMLDVIKSLRFDPYNTTFSRGQRKRKFWELYEIDNVKMAHGLCACNCNELTLRKTVCGHHLCLSCHQKLKPQEDGTKPCPLCRTAISISVPRSVLPRYTLSD